MRQFQSLVTSHSRRGHPQLACGSAQAQVSLAGQWWPSAVDRSRFRLRQLLGALIAAGVLLLGYAAPIRAHGGGVSQLAAVEAGPYALYAWTSPDPTRVGTLHVTVALADPDTERPVLDAYVEVGMTPVDASNNADSLVARATRADATNKVTYETDLEVPTAGPWQVTVAYESDEGMGNASFDLEVKPRSLTNWLLIGAGILVAMVVGWMVWPRRETGNRRS